MTPHDLLERRAERGEPRGANAVWFAAQPATRALRVQSPRTQLVLRLAIGAWLVGLVALAWTGRGLTEEVDVAQAPNATELSNSADPELATPAPVESAEPLPAPIVVDGMKLARVETPQNPDFDGDDILDPDDRLVTYRQETVVMFGGGDRPDSVVVFADPDDRFNGPILGLNLFGDGGFRPWAANTGSGPLSELTDQLRQVDGEWTMSDESGLTEVARFAIDNERLREYGWQFDYVAGADNVTLQAETASTDGETPEADEWLWISRNAREGEAGLTITSTEVLGGDGLLIDLNEGRGAEVAWARDGFVYRMSSSTTSGDRDVQRSAAPDIERLSEVTRAEWVTAVQGAERVSGVPGFAALFTLPLLAMAALSIGWFLLRRSFASAGVLLLTGVVWFVLASSGSTWFTVVAWVGALALAWWVDRLRSMRGAE